MRKGHYRYIRKSSLGAYKLSDTRTTFPEIGRKNAQYDLEISIVNMIPHTLIRRKAVALIDEIEIINNSDWGSMGNHLHIQEIRYAIKLTWVFMMNFFLKKVYSNVK